MLLLFAIMVAEWPPIWEGVVRSVYVACLSLTFIKFCVCPFFPLVLRVGCDCIN